MTERTVTQIRPENPEEKLPDEWFQKQALASPDNIESAARLLIGLVTGLLGTLLGILSLSAAKLPEYLSVGAVRSFGLLGVGALLAGAWFALLTVLPLRHENHPGRPDLQRAAFASLVRWKSRTLTTAVALFALGLTCLALVLLLEPFSTRASTQNTFILWDMRLKKIPSNSVVQRNCCVNGGSVRP